MNVSGTTVLLTGGTGFIGSNVAAKLLQSNSRVVLFDNLSRPRTQFNYEWLRSLKGDLLLERADVRDAGVVSDAIRKHKPELVIHLASQVAVTTSVADPRSDMEINILGTFNVLEAVRLHAPDAVLLNASTNKVYGPLSLLPLREVDTRYSLIDEVGIDESTPLDFHSPYGCSKGAADQYVIDYARIYGLKTVTFRQSCIYGPRQVGSEDQGWLAWLIIAHLTGKPITLYGNGKQVRDVLFVDDLVRCYEQAVDRIDRTRGRAYNVGGGLPNAISLLEFIEVLGEISGRRVTYGFGDRRPGDQPIYVSDIRRAQEEFGWTPTMDARTGIERLYRWIHDNLTLFART